VTEQDHPLALVVPWETNGALRGHGLERWGRFTEQRDAGGGFGNGGIGLRCFTHGDLLLGALGWRVGGIYVVASQRLAALA